LPVQTPLLPSSLLSKTLSGDDVLEALFEFHAYQNPDPKIQVQPVLAVGQGTAGGVNLDPPANQDLEFLVQLITCQDVNNIDAADFVVLNYLDVITNQNIQLGRGKFSDFAGNLFTWPIDQAGSTVSRNAYFANKPALIKRKNNTEPWLRIVAQINTTATVGSRNFQVIYCYLPRQTLNP
jgi:hypothetical protein